MEAVRDGQGCAVGGTVREARWGHVKIQVRLRSQAGRWSLGGLGEGLGSRAVGLLRWPGQSSDLPRMVCFCPPVPTWVLDPIVKRGAGPSWAVPRT